MSSFWSSYYYYPALHIVEIGVRCMVVAFIDRQTHYNNKVACAYTDTTHLLFITLHIVLVEPIKFQSLYLRLQYQERLYC